MHLKASKKPVRAIELDLRVLVVPCPFCGLVMCYNGLDGYFCPDCGISESSTTKMLMDLRK